MPGFPGSWTVKNQPAMWETWVQSLCWEGPVFWPGDFHELPSPTKSQTQLTFTFIFK